MKKLNMEDITQQQGDPYIIQSNESAVSDEISLKAIEELLNLKKLKTISRVKFEQVPILSKLYMYSDVFGERFTRNLADYILQLQISTNGLGRRELVQLVQQRQELSYIDQKKNTSKEIFR